MISESSASLSKRTSWPSGVAGKESVPASGSGGRPQGRVRQARSAPSRPTADACLALRASNDEAFSTWACPADLIRRARFGILSAHAARPLRRPSAVSPALLAVDISPPSLRSN